MSRLAPDHARSLAGGLTGVDFNRFPTSAALADTFKQWVHVAVVDPSITLVANFSAIPAPSEPAVHRLIALVYTGDVRGHVRRFDRESCAMPYGRSALWFGDNQLTVARGVHQLSIDEPALALRARLTMRGVAPPSVLHHLGAGGRGVLHWAVAPRLHATGTIEYAGRTYTLIDAPGYRDRNWGSFRFGDVSWDWGYITAPAGGPPCALVFARMMNAARTRIIEQEVLVWWGDSLLASLRDRELSFEHTGAYDGPLTTVPPALALCRPGRATGVPEAVTVVGQSSRGRIEVRFTRAATARIMAPNDARAGITAIYESFGEAQVIGRLDDRDLAVTGLGFFECVHA
jgi:hypothetical protein